MLCRKRAPDGWLLRTRPAFQRLGNRHISIALFERRSTSRLASYGQNPSSESSSSIMVEPSKPSSLRLPISFSNHSAYFFSFGTLLLNIPCSPLEVEPFQASSSLFCSRAACTEAVDRPVSSGIEVILNIDTRRPEDTWSKEPVRRPMTAAIPR